MPAPLRSVPVGVRAASTPVASAALPVPAPSAVDEHAHDYTDATGLALPSIDEYLAIDPASLPRSVSGFDVPHAVQPGAPATSEALSSDASDRDVDETAEERGDDWAIGDAADRLRSLSEALRDKSPEGELSASHLLPPLPMWSDDDMIDIMPVRRDERDAEAQLFGESVSSTPPAERKTWAAHDVPPADGLRIEHGAFGSSEAAAAALEALAQRVRNGELPLPGYAPEMGDAAALAAALASLLGLRR